MHGRWQVHQENNYNPIFDIDYHGDHLHGVAHLNNEEGLRAGYHGAVTQAFDGHVHHGEVRIRIVWPPKRDGSRAIGVYTGTLHDNQVDGHCHDELDPNHPVRHWRAVRI